MNKSIMMLWTVLIVMILTCIFIFGLKYKEKYPYIKYENNLKIQTKKYIEAKSSIKPDEHINIIVKTEDLIKEGYIKTTKVKNKNCNADITVSYDNKYKYDVKMNCK